MDEISDTWVQRLKNSECYPHRVDQVKLVETHISWVILTGEYAYKIKKPVKYSFVDFSTLEKRRWFCEEELRLNGRLASELYIGVVPITGSPFNPQIDGQGEAFDFAVKMNQFSVKQEINAILADKENGENVISLLAERIAAFHAQIEKVSVNLPYGNPDMVWQPMKECFDDIPAHHFSESTRHFLTIAKSWLQDEWRKLSDSIIHRKQGGFVRECHGDLHLGNIAIFKKSVCVFDALEFEPRLRWIDVMSEVAFLVMDLERHGCRDLAFVFLNRYLELTGDYEGLKVFRLYLVYRAVVRAKVAGLQLAQLAENSVEKERAQSELAGYVELAHRVIVGVSPSLILMHGVSGTGKTTVSREIVKALGAIHTRSDVERKRLFAELLKAKIEEVQYGVLYSSDMTQRTYAQLQNISRILLCAGYSVVVDATFLRFHQREQFRRLAKEQSCALFIMAVFASDSVLAERIERRTREGRDASDATVKVMKRQQESQEPFTNAERPYVISQDSSDPQSIISAIEELKGKVGL